VFGRLELNDDGPASRLRSDFQNEFQFDWHPERQARDENQLGVTLMQRTTRKLSLTAQGRAYYNQCSEPLSYLFDAENALTRRR
jgi:hypothetical protein